jgi:hypothetical protein
MCKPDGERQQAGRSDVDLHYRRFRIATVNGKKIHEQHSNQSKHFDHSKNQSIGPWIDYWNATQDGWPETGEYKDNSRFSRNNKTKKHMRALIPDTQANRDALEQLSIRLNQLLMKMVDFLSPENAEKNLLSLKNNPFLLSR